MPEPALPPGPPASAVPSEPLAGVRVVSTAGNLPGPVAAARLHELGARVTKVEPPSGDPLRAVAPHAYDELVTGQDVVAVDLRSRAGRERLAGLLDDADVLLTSSRPASLRRLGLGWDDLHVRHPGIVHVAVVGSSGTGADHAGHDLTYQATSGALTPPQMPTVLLADLAGAERAVTAVLALLLRRATTGEAGFEQVSLADACAAMTSTLRWGLTGPGSPLGGALPAYALYAAADGWVALAALEPHFLERARTSLGVSGTREEFAAVFRGRTAAEWEAFGVAHDIPLAAVRPPSAGAR